MNEERLYVRSIKKMCPECKDRVSVGFQTHIVVNGLSLVESVMVKEC